jgi:hypothetical protein
MAGRESIKMVLKVEAELDWLRLDREWRGREQLAPLSECGRDDDDNALDRLPSPPWSSSVVDPDDGITDPELVGGR